MCLEVFVVVLFCLVVLLLFVWDLHLFGSTRLVGSEL